MEKLDRRNSPKISNFTDLSCNYPQYITLANGVKLYIVDNGDQDVCRLEVICRGGTFDETKCLQSTILASMLVHGSEEYSSKDVAEVLDFTGSYMNAVSHDNYTHVTLNSLVKNLYKVLPVFKSVLEAPQIPQREFDLLKTQLKSAYQTAKRKVRYLAQMEGRRLYYGERHPLSHSVSDEDVDNITRDDVLTFHRRFYRSENYTFVVSGKVDDNVIDLIEQHFGCESCCGSPVELVNIGRNPVKEQMSIVNLDDALQTAVYMVLEGIARNHPDYITMRILTTALGGYFGSRLMQNIREDKGYTYGINAMLMGRKSGSKLVISSECDTAYTFLLIEEVKNEIRRLQQELMCEEELKMVKNCMLSDLAKTLDSPFSIAGCVSSNILYGTGEDYFNRQVQEIINVTPSDILNVANKYWNVDDFQISIAGNVKELNLYKK